MYDLLCTQYTQVSGNLWFKVVSVFQLVLFSSRNSWPWYGDSVVWSVCLLMLWNSLFFPEKLQTSKKLFTNHSIVYGSNVALVVVTVYFFCQWNVSGGCLECFCGHLFHTLLLSFVTQMAFLVYIIWLLFLLLYTFIVNLNFFQLSSVLIYGLIMCFGTHACSYFDYIIVFLLVYWFWWWVLSSPWKTT